MNVELTDDDDLQALISAAVLYNRIKMGLYDTGMGVADDPIRNANRSTS